MQDELPGARLRRAREEKGISRDEASRALHLSKAYLNALENDEYGKLPEPAFIKGYLRNYARFLGVPSEELATQYQQSLDSERAHAEARRAEATEDEQSVLKSQWRLPALAVLVLVLLIALGWWLWPAGTPLQAQAGSATGGDGAPSLDAGSSRPASASPAETPGPDAGASVADEATTTSEAVLADTEQAAQNGADSAVTGGEATDPVSSASAATVPVERQSTARTPAADEQDSVAMRFSRVCWIKIVDAAGATLAQGQQAAGTALALDGEAPFRVTIGDAGAVSSVVVNGEQVSLPSRRSGDVIHVTLP